VSRQAEETFGVTLFLRLVQVLLRPNRVRHPWLELLPLAWNQLFSWMCRIFDGEPEPLRRKML
jgi:hypothetical protein